MEPGLDTRQAITVGIETQLADATRITVMDLAVTFRRTATLIVEAVVAARDLTNPLDALTCVNTALDNALLQAGLFEEFDVARKRVTAGPA